MPNDVSSTDPLQALHSEIEGARIRVRKIDPTPGNLKAQIDATVLSLLGDVVKTMAQIRDGMEEIVVDLDERVSQFEGATTAIVGEDVEKLTALAEGTAWLIDVVLASGQQTDEVVAKLKALRTLAEECKEIVEDAAVEEDDEDDDEEDEDADNEMPSA